MGFDVVWLGTKGTSLRFDGQTVTVRRRARLLPGRGERSIHVAHISGMDWHPAGWGRYGWLTFTGPGITAVRSRAGFGPHAARADAWAVLFTRAQQPGIDQAREMIEQARADIHGFAGWPHPPTRSTPPRTLP